MSSAPLPALIDRRTLAAETGLTRAGVDAVFSQLDVIVIEGLRKPMVRRADVHALLEQSTYSNQNPRVR